MYHDWPEDMHYEWPEDMHHEWPEDMQTTWMTWRYTPQMTRNKAAYSISHFIGLRCKQFPPGKVLIVCCQV